MVSEINGVVSVDDVADDVVNNKVPPTDAVYHLNVPVTPPLDALIFTVEGEQTVVFVTVTVTAGAIVAVTVTRGEVHAGDVVTNSTV